MPMTIIYEQALHNFTNWVNRKLYPEMGGASRTLRSINKTPRKVYRGNKNEKLVKVELEDVVTVVEDIRVL